ncbi:MAG: cysteine--tRNA ligase, partial [bacterium]
MKNNPIFIYNTLTRKKEKFEPLKKGTVKMYICGITPYDDTHLGHGRCYVTFDMIRRYLEYKGFKVDYIQNVTDIDDKIIKRAREDKDDSKNIKEKCRQLTEKYFSEYRNLMTRLNVREPTMFVKATETITDMQAVISTLMQKGFAYEVDGDVYFSVRKFADYGKLSGRNINEMRSGARVEIDERKKDPLDFAL